MRIGSIAGIDIRIDPSWVVIFLLILWTFSFGVFPQRHPGLDQGVYLGMGVAGTVLFFVSILLHELSHALVSRRRGIEVPAITLFIFGGVAHSSREPDSAGDEFVIAGVGPLSSLLIAAAFGGIWWIGGRVGLPKAVTGVAGYLALVNVALAVFNLLPGFPLDGGRVFRSAVWKATGDLDRATRAATTGGKWVGYGLMGWGLAQYFLGGLIGALWLVFIGWFLKSAADSARRAHEEGSGRGLASARGSSGPGEPDTDTDGPDGRAAA